MVEVERQVCLEVFVMKHPDENEVIGLLLDCGGMWTHHTVSV